MNLRPSGYEPDELPDCSTPRHMSHKYSLKSQDVNMGEKERGETEGMPLKERRYKMPGRE